jgi:hypothetical protein
MDFFGEKFPCYVVLPKICANPNKRNLDENFILIILNLGQPDGTRPRGREFKTLRE